MTLVIAEGLLSACWDEIGPLSEAHWRETTTAPDLALDIHREGYDTAERDGRLVFLTARLADRLVGYALFVLATPPHHRRTLYGVLDALFVDPVARGRWIGQKLIRAAETVLAARGCALVAYTVKPHVPALGALLRRARYETHEVVYSKRLQGATA